MIDNQRAKWKAKSSSGYWLFGSLEKIDGNNVGAVWQRKNGRQSALANIDARTICLSTGIQDSDGRLIYEHDIIEAKDVKGIGFYEKSEILWDGCEWSKKSGIICSIRGLLDLYEKGEITIKVIGNKFDSEVENG